MMRIRYLAFVPFLLAGAAALHAGEGKIAGRVTEASSGEALVSANVILDGTSRGAASDLNGDYFILNVPVGTYTVVVSQVGYTGRRVTGVEVASERTTRLDFALEPTVLEMAEVSVTWQKPPVDLQVTSSSEVRRGETLEQLPVQTVARSLEIVAGAATGSGGELHLRGGRSGEIGYYVDGQRIEDPITGESRLFINREAVEEISLMSGTFNAEYGDAMSGIVQIVTREGGDRLRVEAEYLSPVVNSSPYRRADWVRPGSDAVRNEAGQSLYQPTTVLDESANLAPTPGRFSLSLGGPLRPLPRSSFFLSSVLNNEDSHLPFGFDQERGLNGKWTLAQAGGAKLTLSGGYYWENYQNYSHAWKYVPEHYHRHFLRDQRLDARWTQPLGREAFLNFFAGYHRTRHDVKIFEEWADYVAAGYQKADFTFAQWFYDENDWSDTWQESRTETWSAGANGSYQYGHHHLLKGGVEGRLMDINMRDIRELEIGPDGQPAGLIDAYRESPVEAAAYLQDKIELPYLVVNAGLRWDYADPRSTGWTNPENPDSGLSSTPRHQQLSPRLGLAHPISEKLSLYFAYGHFFQYPDYVTLFMNTADLNPDTLSQRSFDAVGNRGLNPQRTVAYEVGLKGNLSENLGFTVTAFYKDITDLVGTKQVRVGTKYSYALFRNIDYASVRGVTLGLTRTLAEGWSVEGNYTYSVAKGNSSEPLQGFWNAYYQMPEAVQEYYLDFDRRHVLNAIVTWQSGAAAGPGFLDRLKSGINLGATASWASGLPYTPYTGAGEQLALNNSARMDPTATVDLRLSKRLTSGPVSASLLAYVENLFNLTNDLVVNTSTGEPWEDPLEGNAVAYDQIHDPSRVDLPRTVRVGLGVEF
ncbi:MAG: TonB-dependent receptor [Candidatus Zixiibacteriota bacterium]|nr:MAG: TonB-dependent receptor [candidate division Zixibacteria bacterium]